MKRIHFSQQSPLGYAPIRAGLQEWSPILGAHPCPDCSKKKNKKNCPLCAGAGHVNLVAKYYTTRKNPLRGDYVVIGGSRMKPYIIEPQIQFKIGRVWKLNLKTEQICEYDTFSNGEKGIWQEMDILEQPRPLQPQYTFPEMDLGIKKVSFQTYRDVLLKMDKSITIDTIMYINELLPIGGRE